MLMRGAGNYNTAKYCSCGFKSPALCWSLCPSSSYEKVQRYGCDS
ncbi:unnamed protein product [Larinioides sclopetarius]|uniref:Uncharacterized protein n=1 Tax=Larinioides sclopetarius TaxID=280406 RepID=A0AAV1Z2X8_9ARAC